MRELTSIVAENLIAVRKRRGLSLDRAAESTGVSKAMLGQIERGQSSPTIATLWKIASGLHVSLSELIAERAGAVEIIRAASAVPMVDEADGTTVVTVFPFDQGRGFEVFSISIEPHRTHSSTAHDGGSEELITILEGDLDVVIAGSTYSLSTGDAMRFAADVDHSYANLRDAVTRFQNIIYYSSTF